MPSRADRLAIWLVALALAVPVTALPSRAAPVHEAKAVGMDR